MKKRKKEENEKQIIDTGHPVIDALANYRYVVSRNWNKGYLTKSMNTSSMNTASLHNTATDDWTGCFDNFEDVIKFVQKYDNAYETFNRDRKVKPYIDYERVISMEESDHTDPHFELDMQLEQKSTLKYMSRMIVDAMSKLGCDISESDLRITNGSGVRSNYYKISFHIIVDAEYYFTGSTNAKALEIYIKEYAGIMDPDELKYIDYIDKKVYVSPQQMRCINSCKYKYVDGSYCKISKPLTAVDLNNNVIPKKDICIGDYLITNPIKFTKEIDATHIIEKYKGDEKIKNIAKKSAKFLGKDVRNQKLDVKSDFEYHRPDLEAKIIKLMKKFIPCDLVSAKDGFYDFNYDHNKMKCPLTNKQHDHLPLYAFVTPDHKVMVRCRSDRCYGKNKKKVTKIVGTIYDSSYFDTVGNNNNNNINVCVKTLMRNETIGEIDTEDHKKVMKHVNNFIESDDIKALAIQSYCASGKSFLAKYIMDKCRFQRVLMLSHRRTFAKDSAKRFEGFVYYFDEKIKGDLIREPFLINSPESLHRLLNIKGKKSMKNVEPYDMVIIDESESILSQFCASTIKIDKPFNMNEIFYKCILQRAKKILCLDADLDLKTMTLLQNFKTLTIRNTYTDSTLKTYTIIKDDKTKTIIKKGVEIVKRLYKWSDYEKFFMSKIISDIESKNNIIIVTLDKSYGKVIYDRIKDLKNKDGDPIKIMFHHSDDSDSNDLIFDDINGPDGWTKYNVVIYTGKVGQGIDFKQKHFHSIYGYITNTEHGDTFMQLCNRARYVTNNNVLCLVDSTMSLSTNAPIAGLDDAIVFYKYIDSYRNLSDFNNSEIKIYDGKDEKDGKGKNFSTEVVNKENGMYTKILYHEIQRDLNKKKHNYITNWDVLLQKKGSELFFKNLDEYDAENLPEILNKKTKTELLCETKMITEDEYFELVKKPIKTDAEKSMIYKHKIMDSYNVSSLPDDLIADIVKHESSAKNLISIIKKNDKKSIDNTDTDTDIDNFDAKKKDIIIDKIKLIQSKLGFDWCMKKDNIDPKVFDDKEIIFTKHDVMLMGVQTKTNDPYYISKALLNRSGMDLNKVNKIIRVGKKTKSVLISFSIEPIDDVMNLAYLLWKKEVASEIDKKYLDIFEEKYNKYKYLIFDCLKNRLDIRNISSSNPINNKKNAKKITDNNSTVLPNNNGHQPDLYGKKCEIIKSNPKKPVKLQSFQIKIF